MQFHVDVDMHMCAFVYICMRVCVCVCVHANVLVCAHPKGHKYVISTVRMVHQIISAAFNFHLWILPSMLLMGMALVKKNVANYSQRKLRQ